MVIIFSLIVGLAFCAIIYIWTRDLKSTAIMAKIWGIAISIMLAFNLALEII